MLVVRIFSFSYNVFYPLENIFQLSITENAGYQYSPPPPPPKKKKKKKRKKKKKKEKTKQTKAKKTLSSLLESYSFFLIIIMAIIHKFNNSRTDRHRQTSIPQNRKHCGKKRKSWLPTFSPFPTMFSKYDCLLTLYQMTKF